MEKYVPYGKLSKKKRRELNAKKRGIWGGLSPVTRKPPNPRAYKRNKRKWDTEDPTSAYFSFRACRRVLLLYN